MTKTKKAIPYLLVSLLSIYLLPLLGAFMTFHDYLIYIAPAIVLAMAFMYSYRHGFTIKYPLFIFLLSLPWGPLLMASGLIRMPVYAFVIAAISLIGNLSGRYFSKKNDKRDV